VATLAETLEVLDACDHPEAINAVLEWCSAKLDSGLRDMPIEYRRLAVNTVDRAANELRGYLRMPERSLSYNPQWE